MGRFAGVMGCAGILALGLGTTTPAGGQVWIQWQKVTATNLAAVPSLGANDIEEKDFIAYDFDQDGDPDLISVRKTPFTTFGNRQNVYYENVDGVLTDATAQFVPGFISQHDNARDVMIGEFNGDSWMDFVVANAGNQSSNGQQPRIFINLGVDGFGNWLGFNEESSRLPFLISPSGKEPNACAVGVGDVTGNHVDDIYLVDYLNDLEDRLLINNGSGFFTDQTAARMPAGFTASAFATAGMIADLNGDGWPEIIKNSTPSISVAYNNGTGNFAVQQSLPVSAAYHFDVGDLNGNSKLDIYVVQDGQDQHLINNSPMGAIPISWIGTTVSPSPLTAGFGGNVHIADLDMDGDADVVVTDADTDVPGCTRRTAYLRNSGAAPIPGISDPYAGALEMQHEDGVYDIAVADFNSDGFPDLFVGHCNGNDIYFQVPPVPPVMAIEGLTCQQAGLGVQLGWTNPQAYDSLAVRRNGVTIATLAGSTTAYADPGPGSGSHSYTLVASAGGLNSAPVSCVLLVSTVNPVSGLTCVQFEEDLQLQWANQGGITGLPYTQIEVQRNGVLIALLPGTATTHLDVAPPLGNTLYSVVPAIASDASAPTSCVLNIAPANATDLVLDFTQDDGGATDSATALAEALMHKGRAVNHALLSNVSELAALNIVLNDFERVWVELGTFPNNKILTIAEGALLAAYVTDGVGGGDLYLGGGDTFFLGPQTALHALLGLSATSDGFSSVVNVRGLAGATCDLSSFTQVSYDGEDDSIDRLSATTGEAILQANVGGNTFTAGIFTAVGEHAIIAQSVEFGAIGNGHDKDTLIDLYLHCLPSGYPPPVADFVATPIVGVVPLTVTFSNRSTGYYETVTWSLGDGTFLEDHDIVYTYPQEGVYTVSLLLTGAAGVSQEQRVDYIQVLPEGEPFIRGDANADGGLDVADAIRTLGYLFGGQSVTDCLRAFDANDDGDVNVADAIRVLGYLFSGGADLPAPFPACGLDLTPDALPCMASACP